MADIMGYDPNRDSGIAEARSYVEIPKDSVSGMFTDDYNPKGRVFAQLVYNVGSGGGGGESQFTPSEVSALKALTKLAMRSEYIPLTVMGANNSNYDLNSQKVILQYTTDENGNYQIAQDTTDINMIDGSEDYLLNINRICL